MLTLKIMSLENKGDADPDKRYRLIGGLREIRFAEAHACDYERTLLGLSDPPRGKGYICYHAVCEFVEPLAPTRFYLLDGNCYVLNEAGQTVDSFWPRVKLVDLDRRPGADAEAA